MLKEVQNIIKKQQKKNLNFKVLFFYGRVTIFLDYARNDKEILRLVTLAQNDGVVVWNNIPFVTLSKKSLFVTLSEVEGSVMLSGANGEVETSKHFNYQLATMFSSFPKSFQVGLSVSIRAFFFALDQPFNCFSLLIA